MWLSVTAPQHFLDVFWSMFPVPIVFPRHEVHLSVRYFLIVLVDPDRVGGGLGRACAVPWPGDRAS